MAVIKENLAKNKKTIIFKFSNRKVSQNNFAPLKSHSVEENLLFVANS